MACEWKRQYDEAAAYLDRLNKAYAPRFGRLNAMQTRAEKMFNAECGQLKIAGGCSRPEGNCVPRVIGIEPMFDVDCQACKWIPALRRIIKLRTSMSNRVLEATMRKRHLYYYPPEGQEQDDTGDEADERLTWIADEIAKEV